MNALLYLLFISLCGISHALRIPVVSRSVANANSMPSMIQGSSNLGHGGSHKNSSMRGRPGVHMKHWHNKNKSFVENVFNAKDVVYATNITLGGKQFPIQLDTGSSDIWVLPPFGLDLTNKTNIQANLTFGIGAVTGNIAFANMTLGPYKVPSQAFLNATNATDFGAIFSNGIFGIMGLAFDQASTVFVETLLSFGKNNTSGRTFLGNVFAQNKTAPNLFTVLLGRTDDPDGKEEGIFTISEYDPEFADVSKQTKLARTPAQTENITTLPRWSVQMDKMLVNGKEFKFNQSSVSEAAPGKQVTVLDTGFTFSQIPGPAVDFIYSSIPGAVFNKTTGLWDVPCENTTNLEFQFGGKKYPIHPLDLTTVKNVNNKTVCNNAYRSITLPPGAGAGFDSILGVSFLKNVYASFDFGDWTPNNTTGVPFVQMLPVTNATDAMKEFKTVRAKQVKAIQDTIKQPSKSNSTQTGSIALTSPSLFENDNVFPSVGGPTTLAKRTRIIMTVTAHGGVHHFGRPKVHTVVPMHLHGGFAPANKFLGMPSFIPRPIHRCAHRVLNSYGPAVLTVLVGLLSVSIISCFIGLVLGLRMYFRGDAEEVGEAGYEPVFDADAAEDQDRMESLMEDKEATGYYDA